MRNFDTLNWSGILKLLCIIKISHPSFCTIFALKGAKNSALLNVLKFLIPRFALNFLITCSALEVHEPYISHQIAECNFPRAFSIYTDALVCQNDQYLHHLRLHFY